jgi:hypothetical protein
MYDPISQREYYSFKAFFAPVQFRTDRVPGEPDATKAGLVRAYDAAAVPPTHLLIRGNEKSPDPKQVCPPAVPAALGGPPLAIEPVALPIDASHPDRRWFVVAETRSAARRAVSNAEAALTAARANVARAAVGALLPTPAGPLAAAPALRAAERSLDLVRQDVAVAQAAYADLEATLRAERAEDAGTLTTPDGERSAELAVVAQRQHGVAKARRELLAAEFAMETAAAKARPQAAAKLAAARVALAKADAAAAAPLDAKFGRRPQATYPTVSTGRRLALARWITGRSNPLAARVAVNHVWARHFGQPLVPTVFDFGRNGQPPVHPALVDWLAAEFMDGGWSLKHLHRLIVTSAAYRRDSHADPDCMSRDPDNRYLWRMNPRRMEAEVVRDSVLAVAGQLDPTPGGPDLDHEQGLTTFRRSVYYRHANEKQVLFLALFDAANVNECYQRSASIVPQQALALANSPLTQAAARRVTERIAGELGSAADGEAFVTSAFGYVLGRNPTADELRECVSFLAGSGSAKARERLIHVLFNHNDFVTVR